MHGKNICDVALSNLPSNAITEAIRWGDFIFSGSRNLVLDLAKARATPAVAGSFKESWWAIERIFDGFFQHSKSPPSPSPRLMASTAHTTSTCSRGTARMRPPRGRWAPDHVKLVLSRAVLIVPCRVVCRILPHVMRPSSPPRTGSLSPARYARARRASLFSGGTARWSPSLARSRSRRRRVPQARRPSCGRWSRWRCGPRRSRRSSWPPLATQIGANSRSRGSTDWRCSRGRRTRWPRTRSSTSTPSAWGLSRGQGAVAQARATRVRGQVLRSYTLLAAETLIIVNHMVRLAGLRFSPGPGGPADRQLRSAREKLD